MSPAYPQPAGKMQSQDSDTGLWEAALPCLCLFWPLLRPGTGLRGPEDPVRVAELGAGSGGRRESSGAPPPPLSLSPTPQGEEPPLSALPLLREGPAGRVSDVPGPRACPPQRPPLHHGEGGVLPLGQEEAHHVRPPVLEGSVARGPAGHMPLPGLCPVHTPPKIFILWILSPPHARWT